MSLATVTTAPDSLAPLLRQAAQGDEAAFRKLVPQVAPAMHALAWRLLNQSNLAEDALQEALLRLWQTAPQWRAETSVKSWAYRLTVNACHDQIRRRRQGHNVAGLAVPLEDAPEPSVAPSAPARMAAAEQRRHLKAALDKLPETQRTAVLLAYGQEMPQAEIAAALQTSTRAVEGLLHRARHQLRAHLNHMFPNGYQPTTEPTHDAA